uniref:Glycolate oxidase iron-sulfur subunit n=1 Tax=Thermogemmatispora argillosa TaxID=2045280 RepID=A0A455T919_9CHLR|nr:glycolate oxidase iron-sulfur subunit [Thermogemmatispora argillosa]
MSNHSTALETTLPVTPPAEGPLRRHTHTYQLMRQCIHCGFCLPTCPTYALLGVEMDSPRGRIYQMQAVAEGRIAISPEFVEHMYCCLGCRACETACPSGVQFGKLIEAAREQIQLEIERAEQASARASANGTASASLESPTTRLLRRAFFDLLLPSRSMTTLLFAALKLYQRSGLQALVHATGLLDLVNALPTPFRGQLKTPEALMATARGPLFARPLPEITPALGQRRYRVGFISGCIMDQVFRDVNEATIRVLAANGCEVITPPQQCCCGALHVHAGEARRGRELARHNIDVFEAYHCDAIIINSAGCGSNLKEYGHLLADDPLYAERAAAFSAKVKDISEFLTSIELNQDMGEIPLTVTYHDACHLIHGQKIKQQPRRLLQSIPGLRLVELKEADWCCGSAGIYNITNQDLASKLLERKMNNIAATGAEAVVTGNPGCMMQIALGIRERGLRMRVLHPVELLDQAYRAAGLYRQLTAAAAARRRRRRQRAMLAGVGASAGALIGFWLARRSR